MNTLDDGLLAVGADIQFRIWNPVMSVLSVQDLNASTRMTAQKAMTYTLAKKTVREIQTQRVKLGEYLVVRLHGTYLFCAGFSLYHVKLTYFIALYRWT